MTGIPMKVPMTGSHKGSNCQCTCTNLIQIILSQECI